MNTLLRLACMFTLVCVFLCGAVYAENPTVSLNDSKTRIEAFNESADGVSIRLQVGDIEFIPVTTKGGDFVLATVKGMTRSHSIGEPNLPMANRLISIPFGANLSVQVESFETTEIALEDFGITVPVVPVQPSVSKSDDPEAIPFEIDESVYQTAGFYELPTAQAEVLGTMRAVRIGHVSIAPFSYDPRRNVLKVYSDITVRVEYQTPNWGLTEEIQTTHYSPFFEPLYERLGNWDGTSDTRDDLTNYPVKYLIISDRMFEAQLAPFIEWKIQKGFTVVTAYTDDIGSSSSQIKSYIQTQYNNGTPTDPAPSFVLFVGDDQQIPAFDGTAGSHITDLPFCEFTGDDFPEIYYGRFSAQNAAQLQPQIDKTLEYERYEMPDPSYLDEVTLVAGVDGTYAITHGNGQINYGTSLYFNEDHGIYPNVWLYPASDGSGVSAAMKQTISDGVAMANYTAHCSHEGWADPSFVTSDIPSLTNYNKYLLGIGNCCLPNTFGSNYSTPCFGEAFLQIEGRGGIGFIGATNSTYWDEDYWWGVGNGPVIGAGPTYEQTGLGAYDGVFHDHGEPVSDHYITNDAINFIGCMAVSEAGSSRDTYYWEAYHIMGDPSVMTYMGVPTTNNVGYPDAMVLSQNQITVTADPASYVGISYDGVIYGQAYVGTSGSVDIDLQPFAQPCEASIVITGQFKEPHIGTIQVITPEGPYVVRDFDEIDDFSGGNGNGEIDFGESVVLGLQIKNVGPDDAVGVTAVLTTSDPYIMLTDDTESFGDIVGNNGTAYSSNAFAFDVAGTIPDGHQIEFIVTMTDVNDSSWSSTFKHTAHAPAVEFLAFMIDDGDGNGNGVCDPGETVNLVVSLMNNGSGQADNVAGTITPGDAFVTAIGATGSFGTIIGGGSAENEMNPFVIQASGATPLGYEESFTLDITGDNGYAATVNFTIIIGDRVAFFADDFSFDQGWTGLGGSGEWTIGAATGGSGSDSHGGPDPAEDHTPTGDNGVLGNDLTAGSGGDYNGGITSTQWVTSPVIDCSDFHGCILGFYRWLGIEKDNYDNVYLQVFDGTSWQTIYENGSSDIDESEWSRQEYDVSEYADYNPDFRIRFGIGSTDGSYNFCGWNIDDLMLRGYGELTFAEVAFDIDNICDSLMPGDTSTYMLTVHNNSVDATLRIRFASDCGWLTCSGDREFVAPEGSIDFPLHFDATGMPPGDHYGQLLYMSNDIGGDMDSIAVTLHLFAPAIDVPTVEITESLGTGESSEQVVTVNNNGPGYLEFTAGCQMFDGKGEMLLAAGTPVETYDNTLTGYLPAGDKGDPEQPQYAPIDKGAGGPDNFGYGWVDSDAGVGIAYDWIDISTVGSALTLGDDDASDLIPIGFTFPFYENSYDNLYIGSNGMITFSAPSTKRYNSALPNTLTPNDQIALWWSDLDVAEYGDVMYYYDAVNERFIVSFIGVPYYESPSGTGSLTFQAVLYPNGQIVLQYQSMDPGDEAGGLATATIGIENSDGTDGLTVTYNAAYVHDELAISFKAARWMSVSPGSGVIDPMSSGSLTITFSSEELGDGVYTGQVSIASNDPATPSVIIPVSLAIESYTCGDASGDGDITVADAIYLINYIFKSGPAPIPPEAGDANADHDVNVGDAIMLINYVFNSGPAPQCP